MKNLAKEMKEIADEANAAKEHRATQEALNLFLDKVKVVAESGEYKILIRYPNPKLIESYPYYYDSFNKYKIYLEKEASVKKLAMLIEEYGFKTQIEEWKNPDEEYGDAREMIVSWGE